MKQQSGNSIIGLVFLLAIGVIMIAIVYNLFFSMNDKDKHNTMATFKDTNVVDIIK